MYTKRSVQKCHDIKFKVNSSGEGRVFQRGQTNGRLLYIHTYGQTDMKTLVAAFRSSGKAQKCFSNAQVIEDYDHLLYQMMTQQNSCS